MKIHFYNFKKRAGAVIMAAAMGVALMVPAGVQAGTKATTGWKVAALNSSTTASLYYEGEYLGSLTVKSSGSQAISIYKGKNKKYSVSAGKSRTAIQTKTQTNDQITVTYDYKGAAYGIASYVD